MNNMVCLVGRMTEDVQTVENNGEVNNTVVIAVPRSFKNADGIYETDFFKVSLWTGIATNVKEYCRKGDLIGVRGRLQTTEGNVVVVAEKVSFLSSRSDLKKSEE